MEEAKAVPELGTLSSNEKKGIPENATKYAIAHNHVPYDIWVHISKYIKPEHVGQFALISRESAQVLNTKQFWLDLLRNHVQLDMLPNYLKPNIVGKLGKAELIRPRIVEALFYSYPSFSDRLVKDYKMDLLYGLYYMSTWYLRLSCFSIICYKFANNLRATEDERDSLVIANDNTDDISGHQGDFLLHIMTMSNTLEDTSVYQYSNDTSIRLEAYRYTLGTDTIELDFIDTSNENKITTQHNNVCKFKVVPWWAPEFTTLGS